MPRSAEAATRFTSTTPHISTPPQRSLPSRSKKPILTTAPAGETNQEKVARLRAAAAKAKSAQESQFDRVVVVGRRWADRAHRFTAFTLIGITGVAAVVTVYALGDMMVYNRRKRAEYFAEQKALAQSALHDAQTSNTPALLTAEQRSMVDDEERYQARLEAKKAEKGYFTRGKEWLFSGLKRDDEEVLVGGAEGGVQRVTDDQGDRRAVSDVIRDEEDKIKQSMHNVGQTIEDKKDSLSASAKKAFEKERALERNGGPLDRIGAPAPTPTTSESGGWTSFMTKK